MLQARKVIRVSCRQQAVYEEQQRATQETSTTPEQATGGGQTQEPGLDSSLSEPSLSRDVGHSDGEDTQVLKPFWSCLSDTIATYLL